MALTLPKMALMNAAGVLDETPIHLGLLMDSHSDSVVIKSATILPRYGNEEPRLRVYYSDGSLTSLNSMGLPNLGYENYVGMISEMRSYNPKKHITASISTAPDPCKNSCENPEKHSAVGQYSTLFDAFQETDVDMIQINLSCPNIKGKPPVGNSPETVEEVLSKLNYKKPWSVKVAPYNTDQDMFKEVVDIVLKYKPNAVVTINSVPLCMDVNVATRRKTIRPNDGYGGLGGAPVLNVALGEVNRWYKEVKKRKLDTEIVGCGGITGAESALKHIMAGASHLEIGTWLLAEGPQVFAQLKRDLFSWRNDSGVEDWDAIIGIVERNPEVAEMIKAYETPKKS